MRRIRILSIVSLLFITLAASAQIEEPRRVLEVGVSGGMNLNKADLRPSMRQKMHNGMNGGISLRYTSEKYFSMICAAQLEINFSQRGWEEDFDNGTDDRYSRTLNYIEVPFMAHLSWGKEERGFQFFINAGPQIGLFLSDEEFYGFTQEKPWDPSNRPNNQTAQYGKKVENTLEYGIAGGAGIELKTGIGNFIVEGRYFFGLSDMFGNSKADPFGRSANTTITAKITYLVDILK